jgi:hypothetical protein
VEDSSVLEICDLRLSIKSHLGGKLLATFSSNYHVLTHLQVSLVHFNAELLVASETDRVSSLSGQELHGQDAHPDQVRPVNSLVRLGNDCLYALEVGAFSCPISG